MVDEQEQEERSEFGKGCVYCLALFVAHKDRPNYDEAFSGENVPESLKARRWEMWFNAASDHLYELQIPDSFPAPIQTRLRHLQHVALHFGHGCPDPRAAKEDCEWCIEEALKLLRIIDKLLLEVPTQKGQHE